MYRYLAVLSDEAGRMMRARAARSASVEGQRRRHHPWRAGSRRHGRLALPALYERSERVYAAMQSRGFEGELRHMHGRPLGASVLARSPCSPPLFVLYEVIAGLWLPRP